MAESNQTPNNNVFSENDPLDINELASLDEEISTDFIEQLQKQISQNSNLGNDGDLFEEPKTDNSPKSFNDDIDDNFIKKYKAKLRKQKQTAEEVVMPEHTKREEPKEEENTELLSRSAPKAEEPPQEVVRQEVAPPEAIAAPPSIEAPSETVPQSEPNTPKDNIENLTGGNITEKPLTQENTDYNDSLDYLDSNVKYSKYVIYIDPENKDFIESLTVKERKNLINRIIHDQDSIAVTKIKFNKMQTIITHAIIAILTITIAIPCIYWTINASLEATINNYRASQDVFVQLYKQNGKIRTNR